MSAHPSRPWRSCAAVALLALAACVLAAPRAIRAQNPAQPPAPAPPKVPTDTTRRAAAARDTTARDTTARDTTAMPAGLPSSIVPTPADSGAPKELVKWAPTDSIFESLLKRPGYRAVRYQGDTVIFRARDRVLTLRGVPSAVQRDETILVGRSVVYNDSTQIVVATADTARADSVVLRDPSQGADVIVRTSIAYNLTEQRGTIRNFSTSATQGETWYVTGARGAVVTDTTVRGGRIFFAHNGSVTTCNDSLPHYHFQAKEIKYVSKSLIVVRPAVLYIGDVPVMWLPFVFQDTRSGRRSGILPPRIGVAELVRNSSNYHRSVENVGYYFNMGNYSDATAWFDWRSGAEGSTTDPGWLRFNAETRYRITNRFLQGRLSASWLAQRDGSRNKTISLQHEQAFNQNRRISANVNWVQSTTLQRQNTFNPNAVLGTITSQLNYQDKFGPLTFSAGGTRKQYPGRQQVDQDLPNINLTSRTISLASWLDWTPTFSVSNSQSFNIDQGTQFDSVYSLVNGRITGHAVKASRRNTAMSFETPLKIFSWSWQNSFRFTETVEDFPQTRTVYRDVNDTTTKETRVFNQIYASNLFYTTGFALPSFFHGTWNLSPTVSFSNIDPSFGTFVRTEQSGGKWVAQGFRYSFGISSSPTFYAFPPGFGPVERFRHSINPVISYSYSPAAKVTPEFLRAIGGSTQGYLGSLPQSRATLQLSTNLEAKIRRKNPTDTASINSYNGQQGDKIRLVSLQFTSLSYDFVIADSVGGSPFNKRGFVDQTWGYNVQSDLLPGFNVRTNYSLFLGNPQSDTAVFKPYLTDVNVTFSLDRNSGLVRTIGRMLGLGPPTPAGNSPPTATTPSGVPRGGDPFFSQSAVASQVAGTAARNSQYDLTSQEFRASVTFTSARQRPDLRGNLVTVDPTVSCQGYKQAGDQIGYDLCVSRANTAPPAGSVTSLPGTSYGGPIFQQPPTKSLQANMSFHLTPKWGTQWNTTYDIVRGQFASNVVSLQRELHDWRAVFAFTQSPNGNSVFNFFVALKAEPDLKFDYNRNTLH
jgi:hypothetical protein